MCDVREAASSDRDWSFHSARKAFRATLSGKYQTADVADPTDTSWPQSCEHESRTPYYRNRESRSSASRMKSSEVLPVTPHWSGAGPHLFDEPDRRYAGSRNRSRNLRSELASRRPQTSSVDVFVSRVWIFPGGQAILASTVRYNSPSSPPSPSSRLLIISMPRSSNTA